SFDTRRLQQGFARAAARGGVPVEAIAAQARDEIPAKRFGTSEEFGQACAFLCSSHAGYITGQSLLLDGGAFPGAF
ncbi:MAG: SDR family oxidoreductase, partial [Proteobacteria bacterium]|nr:SDR family oxidoreductase [Pseudomonadota bacterium]